LEYKLIKSADGISPFLAGLRKAKTLAVDTETTGLDPHTGSIRLIQLAAADLPVLIIDCFSFLPDGTGIIKEILETRAVKIFQNAKFDLQFLMALGIRPAPVFDTMLAGQLLRSSGGSQRANLAALAAHYLGEELPKDEQKSDWSGELTENQLAYAARDAETLLRLREAMAAEIYRNNLAGVALLEFNCVRAMAEIEYTGVSLDTDRWKSLLEQTERERGKALDILFTYTGHPAAQLDLWGGETAEEHGFDSNTFVLKLLRSNGIQTQSTSKNDLAPYSKYPLVRALTDYRKAAKLLSSFLYPIPKMIHPKTGRVHPQYAQIGAWSGRMACWSPNIQQIPRSADFRACFTAPPGSKLIIADYSQIELRVAAEITRDSRMMAAYQSGEDLHALTASLMTGKPATEVTKQERQAAKAVNFGLIYSMGAAGLKQYAAASYGVDMPLEQAEDFRSRFFKAYTGIDCWHRAMKKSQPIEGRTPTGRKFTYSGEGGLSLYCNTPVQGTAADIVKKALGMLADRLNGSEVRIIGVVHDEIILEAPDSGARDAAHLLKSVMEEAGNTILPHVPCQADFHISQNWAKN
jgi:DNA polymerase-1